MITLLTTLQEFQSRRRFPNWEPKVSSSRAVPKQTKEAEVVQRCLMFLDLEIQVACWVESANELDAEVKELLLINSADENKHDTVLRMLAEYYGGVQPTPAALAISGRWKDLDNHPMLSAYALEMGVFFTILPTLIKQGDVYAATVASWISDDERCHVETNLAICKYLNLKLTNSLVKLVFDTVAFIYEPMGKERQMKEATRAITRLASGKDEQMLIDSLPPTIAFFEQEDKRSIVY